MKLGKVWSGIKRGAHEARRALRFTAAVGVAFGGIIRGTLGKVLGKAADVEGRVERVEDAMRDSTDTGAQNPGPQKKG